MCHGLRDTIIERLRYVGMSLQNTCAAGSNQRYIISHICLCCCSLRRYLGVKHQYGVLDVLDGYPIRKDRFNVTTQTHSSTCASLSPQCRRRQETDRERSRRAVRTSTVKKNETPINNHEKHAPTWPTEGVRTETYSTKTKRRQKK